MDFQYNPAICDLCGSPDYAMLIDLHTGRAMCSDRRIIATDLQKFACARCGLVRNGNVFAPLEEYYTEAYTLNTQPADHYFHTHQGAVSRSRLICDWFVNSMGDHHWRRAKRVLEVGAGSGMLLAEFQKRFPDVAFEGIELSKGAVIQAQAQGLPVQQSTLGGYTKGDYDIVYALGVLEHAPSPTDFLNEIHKRLRPGCLVYLCQPTQEVKSYDIFFADHIHHFGADHVGAYARKCGFRELGFVIGHEWIPNFSVHLWQAIEKPQTAFSWIGSPGFTTCEATAATILQDMEFLNQKLAQITAAGRRIAVFGLTEVYALTKAYSRLGDFQITCGLDDVRDKPEYTALDFPVVAPEEARDKDVQDVILTMNSIYYERVIPRIEALGLSVHPVLSVS